jgi:ubiquinone/menaquinone biosynthesis C-methylase UbiE
MTSITFDRAPPESRSTSPVDWDSYARCYDLLCTLNPAYLDLLQEFNTFVRRAELRAGSRVLDLGGGTGNFFCHALPQEIGHSCELMHLDFDAEMLSIANEKYKKKGLNVRTIHRDASKSVFPVGSLDCVLTVNTLYAMPTPVAILERVFHWLRPGGFLFFVDLGRIQNTAEWTSFLVRSNARKIGLLKTIRILLNEGRVISRANRRIADAQRQGLYWQHSTVQVGELLERIGFEIHDVRRVYRGYSDLAICRKPSHDIASPFHKRLGLEVSNQSI